MPESVNVFLWEKQVGVIKSDARGVIHFSFDKSFINSGLNISPLELPLMTKGAISFPDLMRIDAFGGLPGVFADSLPDTFGNKIIKEYFNQKGKPDNALSSIQKLLYIGDRAMGALEYRPALKRSIYDNQALEVKSLVESARKLIEGDTSDAINEIMTVGASAGGARAKAVILLNKDKTKVKSGFAKPDIDDHYWLIKFDGISSANPEDHQAKPYNRVEYVYSLIAKECGLVVPETCFIEGEDGLFHFLTKRFDRTKDHKKIHMHSLGGLTHTDFNTPCSFSYEGLFRVMQDMELSIHDMSQAFKLMIFNVIGRNQDDHVKNISFLMDESGKWSLSPAYDLTYSVGQHYTKTHQMTINGKADNFSEKDLLDLGERFEIKNPKEILESVKDAFSLWPIFASTFGIEPVRIQRNATSFRMTNLLKDNNLETIYKKTKILNKWYQQGYMENPTYTQVYNNLVKDINQAEEKGQTFSLNN